MSPKANKTTTQENDNSVVSVRMPSNVKEALKLIAGVEDSHASTIALQFIVEGIHNYADPEAFKARVEAEHQKRLAQSAEAIKQIEKLTAQ